MRYFCDRALVILVFFFILTRLLLLLFDFSDLTQVEELYNGTLAREIVRGPFLPLLQLRYIEYQSGSLIVSFIAIPLFYLFGETYFTLKLVALLFSTATLIIFYLLLKHFYSQRVATWGGIMFVFPPRIFALLNLKVEGANSQAILITFVIWYLFFSLLRYENDRSPGEKREGMGNARAFLIGLLSSFGVWFCPVVLIAIVCIVIISFARDKLFYFRKRFVYSFAGFWVGAIPAIIDYRATGYAGLKYLLTQPYQGRTSPFISLITELWGRGLLDSVSSKSVLISARLINMYFYILVIFSIVLYLCFQRGRIVSFLRAMVFPARSHPLTFEVVKGIAFPLYIVAFSLAYGASKYHISKSPSAIDAYRYLVSLYPFLFIVVVLTMDEIWVRGSRIAVGIVTLAMILGVAEIAVSLNGKDYGRGFRLKGYDYEMLGLRLYEQMSTAPNSALALASDKIAEYGNRDACIGGFAFMFTKDCLKEKGEGDLRSFVSRLGSVDERWRPYFYRALGQLLPFDFSTRDGINKWHAMLNAIDEKYLTYYYEGVGSVVRSCYQDNREKQMECGGHVPPRFSSAFEAGMSIPYPVL
ncbi:MAG: hypothetical protein NTX71_10565 [Candidatus Aureabacteria bacterium]|nr:hypothetical protein [Candidatus Auribacterota bacterium]